MSHRIELSAHGEADAMQWVAYTPPPLAANEVRIENRAIGLNYIDIYVRSGLYPLAQFPSGLGYEGAGVVTDVGNQVTHFKRGDRVAYAQAPLGAYSEIHQMPESLVAPLPDSISFEQAAAVFLKGLTVHYLLHQTYAVQKEEIFLFHAAAGGVGLLACQWAKALGAKLIGTVSSEEKAALARQAGAWATIDSRRENIPQRVQALTQGQKVSVVYDSVGRDTWLDSLDCLRPRGLMVSFGNASGPVENVNLGILNQKGSLYVTRPALTGYIRSHADLLSASAIVFDRVASGVLNVEVPAHQQFALKDAAQAHRFLQSRQAVGACLLIP